MLIKTWFGLIFYSENYLNVLIIVVIKQLEYGNRKIQRQ